MNLPEILFATSFFTQHNFSAYVFRDRYEILSTQQQSNCPIEMGAISTPWGPTSPFHIIASIASALQQTRERYNTIRAFMSRSMPIHRKNVTIPEGTPTNMTRKRVNLEDIEISNVWLASITGDLAEVVLNQVISNAPLIATDSFWNDTLYPRTLYLSDNQWDMSESEMLGGLDGAILSTKAKEWVNIIDTTRLSQIIDMYYSDRGVGYETSYKACNRYSKLRELFEYVDLHEQVNS